MANPVSSFIASCEKVKSMVFVDGQPDTSGDFPGIPVIASVTYAQNDAQGVKGYTVLFNIDEMVKKAAENLMVNAASINVSFEDNALSLIYTSGGGN